MDTSPSEPVPDPSATPAVAPLATATPTVPATIGLQVTLCRHAPALTQYVTRLLPASLETAVDPSDVVQDVYLEAMRHIAEFRPHDADHTIRWLMTIARHRLIDMVRHFEAAKRGGSSVNVGAMIGSVGDTSTAMSLLELLAVYDRSPSQSAVTNECVDLVRRTIAELPPDYAQVLQLKYLDGLPGKAVAARMVRSEGAVGVLCHRAVEALGHRLRAAFSFSSVC